MIKNKLIASIALNYSIRIINLFGMAIYIENGQDFVDSLKENKKVFDLEITNSTTTIRYGGLVYKYTSAKQLKPAELGFIKQVLNYCTINVPVVPSARGKINYIRHGKIKTGYVYKKDLFEIDLNQAYWNYAFQKKYISKEIFMKGMKVSKMCRLMSLGNLARRCTNLHFNGNSYDKLDPTTSFLTEGIFFDVAFLTDVTMKKLEALANDNYMFYWVDAIFVRGENTLKKMEWFLQEYGLKYKIKSIYSIHKSKDQKVIVKDDKYSKPDGTKEEKKGYREFNFQKSNHITLNHNHDKEAIEKEIQIRNSDDAINLQNFLSQKRNPDSI